jgi:antitoxin VapB
VAELARKRGVSKQEAVRLAVQAELQRIAEAIPLRERIAAWRKEHPMPTPTRLKADKAFFDELSGET